MKNTLDQQLEEILIDPHFLEYRNLSGYHRGRKLVDKVLAAVEKHYANQPDKSRKWLG